MKPLRLKFSGIRSYRALAEVDFTGLDLFAIIGDTGAGKSTILEALTFALYGKKTWSGGTLDELIADGEKKLYVEFSFDAAGQTWIVTRTRNRSTTPGVHKLINAAGDVKVDGAAEVSAEVTKLLGLKFEQFTRAVLMPQGRFDALLRASRTDRAKILASILGFDELSRIRTAATVHVTTWKVEVAKARTERNGLPADPDAALAAATDAANHAERVHDGLVAAARAAAVLEDETAEASRFAGNVAAAVSLLPVLETSEVLATLDELRRHAAQLTIEQTAAELDVTEADKAADELDTQAQALLAGMPDRDALAAVGHDLRTAADRISEATQERQQLLIERHGLTEPTDDIDPALTEAFDAAAAAVELAERAREEAAKRHTGATALWINFIDTTDKEAKAAEKAEASRTESGRLARIAEQLTNQRDDLKSLAVQAQDAHAVAVRADAAAEAAAGCEPGDACPVCTAPLPATFAPPANGERDAAAAAMEETRHQHGDAVAAVAEAAAKATQAAALAVTAGETHSLAAAALQAAIDAARDSGVDTTAGDQQSALVPFVASVDQTARYHRTAVTLRADRDRAVTQAGQELAATKARYTADVEHLDSGIAQHDRTIATCRATAAAVPDPWGPIDTESETSITAAADKISVAAGALDGLAGRRQTLHEAARKANNAVGRLKLRRATEVNAPTTATVHAANDRIARAVDVRSAISGAAPSHTDATCPAPAAVITDGVALDDVLSAVRTALEAADVVEAAGRAIHDGLTTRAETLSVQLNAVLVKARMATTAELHAAVGRAGEQVEEAARTVTRVEGEGIRARKLQKILDVGEPFVANLDALADALTTSKFLGHFVQERETELLAEASRRLKTISGGRFGFVADFGVANIASGEIRTPDSLSGGERFQAALALALALVEIASRGGGRLDAVFVDEGFGSLDAKALDVALSALEAVAGAGRTVALISHLRPVAEHVETVLHVTCDDMFGSRIDRLDADARDRLLADDVRSGLTG